LNTLSDASALFGIGSEAYRMVKQFWAINPTTPLYVCLAASTGVAGTGTITVSGTASSGGSVEIQVCDTLFQTAFASADGYASVASSVASAINARTELPLTASAAASGVITLTNKVAGARGAEVRYSARIVEKSTGISITPTAHTAMSGSGADDVTAALAAVAADKFDYIISAQHDATNLALLASQLSAQALPVNDRIQRGFFALVGTLAASTTVSQGVNNALLEALWEEESDLPGAELAAIYGAIRSLEEQSFGGSSAALNFDFYGQQQSHMWKRKAPKSGKKASRAQILSALSNGLSPIKVFPSGASAIVSAITTKCLDGSNPDYRVRDVNKVSVPLFFGDDLKLLVSSSFPNKLFGVDPPQGTSSPKDVVTPSIVRALVIDLIDTYAARGLLKNVAQIKSTLDVSLSSTPGRMGVAVNLDVVDVAHQFLLKVNQVG
jgi:phage tail sheath gpL-like